MICLPFSDIFVRMFSAIGSRAARGVLARLSSVVDELQSLSLATLPSDEVLAVLRELETQKRRLAAVDHRLIAEVDQRALSSDLACRDTAVLLRQLLLIDPREAAARVAAAAELGPRRALTGEVLPPIFQQAAEASAVGAISPAQARIVTRTVEQLPAAVRAEHDLAVEQFLVHQAAQLDPNLLAKAATRLRATLDQDGVLDEERDRQRRRTLVVRQRADGSSHVEAELTATCTEALLAVLDSLARPAPGEDGERDPRTAGQRRHDALHDALLALLRSGELPACNGVAATILLTMTAEQLHSRDGTVTTGHGAQVSVEQALTLLGEAQVMPVIFDKAKEISAYGSAHRIFTQGQRLAMIARDLGCSFPGCSVPATWCQAHHITDFTLSPHTRIDDGTLLCGHHHREHGNLGWRCRMIDGIPHWIPPRWIDPEQTPRRNHMHDVALV